MKEYLAINAIQSRVERKDNRTADAGELPSIKANEVLVATTDQLNQNHLYPGENKYSATKRGLAEAVSDIAAVGAKFLGVQIDLRASKDMSLNDFADIGTAINEFLNEYNGILFQANNLSQGEFGISFTAYGKQEKSKLMHRDGAKSGDLIAISGPSGKWNAALLAYNLNVANNFSDDERKELFDYFVNYGPQLLYGEILAKSGLVHCCIDANDRLSKSLRDLQLCNSLEFNINSAKIPYTNLTGKVANLARTNPVDLALYHVAGDDNLIFTFAKESEQKISQTLKKNGLNMYVIGKVGFAGNEIIVDGVQMQEKGFQYFDNDSIYSNTFKLVK
jgi:thiamine-monophosphate kinase